MKRVALACAFLVIFCFEASIATSQERVKAIKSIDKPKVVQQKGPGHWFFDFGQELFGNVEIVVSKRLAESHITVHLGEATSDPTTVHRNPGGSVRYQKHTIAISGRGTFSPKLKWGPPGWMKDGWLELQPQMEEVIPFRYVEIENAPEGFSSDSVQRIAWTVPFDDEAAHFQCSSNELNHVWEFCKHSIKATSFLGLYVDGDRERKPYEADALINQLSHYCVDDSYDMGRLTHEYLLKHPTWPTEWRLQSVLLAWNDFMWSGNDKSLRQHYETLKSRAMIERRADNGLFVGYPTRSKAPGLEDIVDWPAVERDEYDMSVPSKTVVTAFHYQALVLLEKIARHLKKDEDADEFQRLSSETLKSFNELLWDESQGVYADGIDPQSKRRSEHASAHANFFPLAFGMIPGERVPGVVKFLEDKGMVCSVYGAQFLLDALYLAEQDDLALKLMTDRSLRSWLNMTEKVGATVTMEAWDPTLKPNLDWNHAWGAAPANVIPRGLMGIEPLTPGFKRFQVKPQLGSLTSAKLKMPSPRGTIQLRIEQSDGEPWKGAIEVPDGAVAEFQLPTMDIQKVEVSTGSPTVLRMERDRTVIELSAGTHIIRVQR